MHPLIKIKRSLCVARQLQLSKHANAELTYPIEHIKNGSQTYNRAHFRVHDIQPFKALTLRKLHSLVESSNSMISATDMKEILDAERDIINFINTRIKRSPAND